MVAMGNESQPDFPRNLMSDSIVKRPVESIFSFSDGQTVFVALDVVASKDGPISETVLNVPTVTDRLR